MPAIHPRATLRPVLRWWPWILYAVLLLVILWTAARLRYHIPQTPLFDGDSWGYLAPAFLKLSGGTFQHTFGRNFVYPGFLFVVLCLFGDYESICFWQHALGLLTGVLLALAWNLLCELLPVPARTRMAARFLGLAVVADYLFSRSAILFEHTLRPEAVFPFFLVLSFVLNFYALNSGYTVRRPALAYWALGLNFVVVCVAQSLKPSFGFGVLAANLPLAFWLVRRGAAWRVKVKVAGAALAVAAAALWLPERLLARSDPASTTFLPTMLFTIHAKIIHEQMLDDLRTGHTAPYPAAWLAGFNHNFERVLAISALPENKPWPTIGFDADYLIYRESVFDPYFAGGQKIAAFCNRYYWRTWLHRPLAMLGKVSAELGVVYYPKQLLNPRRLLNIKGLYRARGGRPLAYEYNASLACTQVEGVHSRLVGSRYGQRYLRRLGSLARTQKNVWQFPWIAFLNNWLNALRSPLLVLALLCGFPLLARPETRMLVGAVWLCLLVDFALYLTVAVVHTLDIERYVQNQHACSVFAAFAAVLLPWQWLRRPAQDPPPASGGPTQPLPSLPSTSLAMSPCIALTQTLVECRYLPVYAQLNTIGEKHSMLHLDVLSLLHHFARTTGGDILEIGPYVGGSTIALGLGIKEAGRSVKFTTIEGGGSHPTHPTLPSDDILRDLKRNLTKRAVAEFVTLIEGRSDRPAVIREVRERHAPGSVSLFVVDADGGVERDLALYEGLLSDNCLLVIDDYYPPDLHKTAPTRAGVDALVERGWAETLGTYGWGTWIGRRVPQQDRRRC